MTERTTPKKASSEPQAGGVARGICLRLATPRSELGYLQSSWAVASWLCLNGALFVHDPAAIRWHAAKTILELDPLRELDIEHEVLDEDVPAIEARSSGTPRSRSSAASATSST